MDLSVVIPLASWDNPYPALRSLRCSSIPCEVIVAGDEGKGANHARNRGAALVRTPLILFCDADVEWKPGGLEALWETLRLHPAASFAFGAYEMGGKVYGLGGWDLGRLRGNNYISTMSLLRREAFPASGWDEAVPRLQDWDLWLTIAERGGVGVSCGRVVFSTAVRKGITFGGGISWEAARAMVARKHGLA